MKTLQLIPKFCILIVYILFILLGLFAFVSVSQYVRLLSPLEEPENKEGMVDWTSSAGVRIGDYELIKISHFNADSNPVNALDYYLRVPYPKLLLPQQSNPAVYDTESDYHAINIKDEETEAFSRKDTLTQVIYKLKGKNVRNTLVAVFGFLIFITVIFAFYWLLVLRSFLLSMSRGKFFYTQNFRRLMIISIPAFLIPLLEYISGRISVNYFQNHFQSYGGLFSVTPNLIPLIFGIVILLMAAMVYEGSRLKEDNDLTI